MRHRPADFVSSAPAAPRGLDGLRPMRHLARREIRPQPSRRGAEPGLLDQALRGMLETCPVPDHLLAFALSLSEEDLTEERLTDEA